MFVDAALCVWLPPPLPVGAALPPRPVPAAVAAPAPLPSGTGLACVSAQWSCGVVSNLDYLLTLNYAAGRRIGDCAQLAPASPQRGGSAGTDVPPPPPRQWNTTRFCRG